ncbi:hypothetical protein MASR2M54_10900 [Aliarcobacter cryaerophilus]
MSDLINSYLMKQSDLTKTYFAFTNNQIRNIHKKIENSNLQLKNWEININNGV